MALQGKCYTIKPNIITEVLIGSDNISEFVNWVNNYLPGWTATINATGNIASVMPPSGLNNEGVIKFAIGNYAIMNRLGNTWLSVYQALNSLANNPTYQAAPGAKRTIYAN